VEVTRVRELVRTILEQAPEFDGQAELLAQVPSIEIAGGPITMLDLVVDRSLPPALVAGGPVPGRCWAWAADGTPIGTLLVWAPDGYINTLEYGWITDDPPTELPDPTALTTDTDQPPGPKSPATS
jgi:hypothetical protein